MSRLAVTLAVCAAAAVALVPSASAAERDGKRSVKARAAIACGVHALTPNTRYVAGRPAAAHGRAQYWCAAGAGTLTVQLKRAVSLWADPVVAERRYSVPARSTWSGVLTTPEINCSAYGRGSGYYVVVSHNRGPAHKGSAVRACG